MFSRLKVPGRNNNNNKKKKSAAPAAKWGMLQIGICSGGRGIFSTGRWSSSRSNISIIWNIAQHQLNAIFMQKTKQKLIVKLSSDLQI